jgi:hypothetical protein
MIRPKIEWHGWNLWIFGFGFYPRTEFAPWDFYLYIGPFSINIEGRDE